MSPNAFSSLAVVVARLFLLGLAGGALLAALFIAKREPPHAVDPGGAYLCPMHPEVSSATPGDCPVCGMALEVRKVPAGPGRAQRGSGANNASFQLPEIAAIATFDEVGYGKMFEMAYEMRAPAWAESSEIGQAIFYKDEIAVLGPTEEALFFPSTQVRDGSPTVKVSRIDQPVVEWDRQTAIVRFRAKGQAKLVPGQTGSIKFQTRTRESLVVRTSAVVPSPTGPTVFLMAKDNRTLTKRSVEIGAVRMGHAAILSGLAVGERVAAQGTFFLEAERRFAETAP